MVSHTLHKAEETGEVQTEPTAWGAHTAAGAWQLNWGKSEQVVQAMYWAAPSRTQRHAVFGAALHLHCICYR